jgi:hypothetical protein
MNTAKDRRCPGAAQAARPAPQLRHTLAAYSEEGSLFDDNALNGVL